MAAEPPSYDGFSDEALLTSSHGAQSDLPAYTRRPTPPRSASYVNRAPKEFRYEIKNRGGNPWAVFIVQGNPVLSRAIMPTIAQGANLIGSVKLDLRTPETIQAVCILVSRRYSGVE